MLPQKILYPLLIGLITLVIDPRYLVLSMYSIHILCLFIVVTLFPLQFTISLYTKVILQHLPQLKMELYFQGSKLVGATFNLLRAYLSKKNYYEPPRSVLFSFFLFERFHPLDESLGRSSIHSICDIFFSIS